jgi:hypothetical protein
MQDCVEHIAVKKCRQFMNKVTWGRVGATTIAAENHSVIRGVLRK